MLFLIRKIIGLFSFPVSPTQQQSRISGYLTTMIGNMPPNDLRLFMRFITGSCACISREIKVIFNNLSGLARRPCAHTCDCTLELPTSYCNYDDFNSDFQCILAKTHEEYIWRMDAL